MEARKCVIILNNQCGYCYTPQRYESINAARKAKQEAIENGFAWAGRIITK